MGRSRGDASGPRARTPQEARHAASPWGSGRLTQGQEAQPFPGFLTIPGPSGISLRAFPALPTLSFYLESLSEAHGHILPQAQACAVCTANWIFHVPLLRVLPFSRFVKVIVSQKWTLWWPARWKNKEAWGFQDIAESFQWANGANVARTGWLVTETTEDLRNLFVPRASLSKERAENFFFFKLTTLFRSWVCHFWKRNLKITTAYFYWSIDLRERRKRGERSTDLCTHRLILVCALTRDWTHNRGVQRGHSNQLSYTARATIAYS